MLNALPLSRLAASADGTEVRSRLVTANLVSLVLLGGRAGPV
jgi:hypothetical protein